MYEIAEVSANFIYIVHFASQSTIPQPPPFRRRQPLCPRSPALRGTGFYEQSKAPPTGGAFLRLFRCDRNGRFPSRGLGGRPSLFLFPGEDVAQVVDDRVINGGEQQGNHGGDDHTRVYMVMLMSSSSSTAAPLRETQGHGHQGQDGGQGGHKHRADAEGTGVEDGFLPALPPAPVAGGYSQPG